MKTHILNGIPYSVSEAGEVYMYESNILIGHITSDKKSVMFLDGWKEKSLNYLRDYRSGLYTKTLAMMERAKTQNKKPE